ncbi:HNH endonuclease [Haloarcula laminariae]|uniref:HNH endonuclease n=1 Tax=Haloarcula laminariae TaxID=2961577 RepID=UPI0021C6FBD9|nr:HNH endonuclease [Halomicroarcula laminariae]
MIPSEFAERHDEIRDRRIRLRREKDAAFDAYADHHDYDTGDIDAWLAAHREFEATAEGEQLEAQIQECRTELAAVYETYLQTEFDSPATITKKDRIIAVKQAFGLKVHTGALADALDTSVGYVKDFKYYTSNGGTVVDRQAAQRKWRGDISTQTRTTVLERDNHQCVRCSATETLHLHHIRPAARGGPNTSENLVTLCQSCHAAVHGSRPGTAPGSGQLAYEPATPASFAEWVETELTDDGNFG